MYSRTNHNMLIFLGLALILKLLLATLLPITGDEAYFIVWAQNPDFGYYDHPPMVAWVITPFLAIAQHELLVRIPAILTQLIVAWLIYRLLREQNPVQAQWLALTYLLLPVSLINIFITTDTPLVLFGVLSAFSLYLAMTKESKGWYAAAGMLLGLAFLSKYFAVLLGLAYLSVFFVLPRSRARWTGLLILLACAIPFGLVNLYWNMNNCWNNILFNIYNRNEGASFGYRNLLLYLFTLFYLFAPLLYYRFRNRHDKPETSLHHRFFALVCILPLVVLLLVSLRKTVGLHWLLVFVPFVLIASSRWLDDRQLRRTCYFYAGLGVVHYLVLILIVLVPINWLERARVYPSLVFGKYQNLIQQELSDKGRNRIQASDSYSSAAVMAFYSKKHVPVFGFGSRHARQNDSITDFRKLAGRNFLVYSKSRARLVRFKQFFARARIRHLIIKKASFYFLQGDGFNYTLYHDKVLRKINERFYRIPGFLPLRHCPFKKRYFGQ